jgi:hypothetical protein
MSIAADYVNRREPIHPCARNGYEVPTTCGKKDTPN